MIRDFLIAYRDCYRWALRARGVAALMSMLPTIILVSSVPVMLPGSSLWKVCQDLRCGI